MNNGTHKEFVSQEDAANKDVLDLDALKAEALKEAKEMWSERLSTAWVFMSIKKNEAQLALSNFDTLMLQAKQALGYKLGSNIDIDSGEEVKAPK